MLIASVNLSLANARYGSAVTTSPATMSTATRERHLGMILSPYKCLVWYCVKDGRGASVRSPQERRAARGLAQRLSLGPTPGGGGEKVRLQFLSASQDPLLSAIAGGAVSSTRVLLRVPLLAGMCTAGNAPYSAGRLGGVSSRTLLWAPHLAESLITGHLDPRLPRHADARTFRI